MMNIRPQRVRFHLTPNSEELPYDYQFALLNRVQRWLNPDGEPGLVADYAGLYSFSWLRGAYNNTPTGISFPEGAQLIFSTAVPELLQRILKRVGNDNDVYHGMQVVDVFEEPVRAFLDDQRFLVSSPVLLLIKEGAMQRPLLYNDPRCEAMLTDLMYEKLATAKLSGDVSIRFDTRYRSAKYKTVRLGTNRYVCSECPINVVASSIDIINFAWAVGVGEQTERGFGSLY